MKILIDQHIPFLEGILDNYAQVEWVSPEEMTAERVHDADALIIRTRTKVNRYLLDGSRVRFVATATIGYDHIDTDYLEQQHIAWTACPGCNAQAVCDYVEEVLNYLQWLEPGMTLGIVGLGHVGTRVQRMAEQRGLRVLINDAPKRMGANLDEIAQKCDVISFHVPLTCEGDYPTYHLCNEAWLSQTKPSACIINAARGGVVDERALLRSGRQYVLDTWENEPNVDQQVLAHATLASYHIAGYSTEGKINASNMCLKALCQNFGLPILSIDKKVVSLQSQKGDTEPGWLERITQQLKAQPDMFEQLRKQYILR